MNMFLNATSIAASGWIQDLRFCLGMITPGPKSISTETTNWTAISSVKKAAEILKFRTPQPGIHETLYKISGLGSTH